MRAKIIFATAIALALVATSYAQMTPDVKTVKIGDKMVLADSKGMTLYTFDGDKTAGKSSCNARCATLWPPFLAGPGAMTMKSWSVVTRDDGTKQWAYEGQPLYTFSKDTARGEAKGDGAGPKGTHVWHVAVKEAP